jgi:hypothetical protein
MYRKPILFVAFAMVTAQAATIYPIGQASTAGFAQGAFAGARPRGWDFQVNASGVQVTQLGVNAAIGDNITLTLWDNASMTELAQIVVASTASTWVFGNLGSPVDLVSGNTYSVIGWDNNANSSWYLFNNTPPAAFNPTGTIQYLDTRVGNLIDQNTYPTNTLASPAMYGVTDIGYVIAAPTVPEPTSLGLTAFGVGLIFLVVRARRANTQG